MHSYAFISHLYPDDLEMTMFHPNLDTFLSLTSYFFAIRSRHKSQTCFLYGRAANFENRENNVA